MRPEEKPRPVPLVALGSAARGGEVKEKFSIPEDLAVTDDTGTEVDKDVFPDLMTTRPSTPQSSVSLDTDTLSRTSKSSEDSDWFSPKRFRKDDNEASQSLQARDLIKEILHTRPGGANVLKECEDTGTISDDMRKLMVNILVAHMIETEGRVPHRLTKQNYGLGIITLFPSLRDPQGRTGYEHFYDGQKNTGFLSWRLKTVQRGTKPSANKDDPKTEEKGGPLLDRQLCHREDQLDNDQSLETISLMNHTSDREVIMQKMRTTFEYRQHLIHDPEKSTTILSVFPPFLDTKGSILQDFTLLFGSESASRLFERWPTYCLQSKGYQASRNLDFHSTAEKITVICQGEKGGTGFPRQLTYVLCFSEWDSDLSSFLLLLHLLSPQASGRKKPHKISISQAVDHVVVFQKACRSIQEHLEAEENRQPYILATGSSKEAISQFFIVVDKKLIPCQESSSLAAIDELFKVHFVFSISYDLPLTNMYTFLQTTIYGIDVGTTSESPRFGGGWRRLAMARNFMMGERGKHSRSRRAAFGQTAGREVWRPDSDDRDQDPLPRDGQSQAHGTRAKQNPDVGRPSTSSNHSRREKAPERMKKPGRFRKRWRGFFSRNVVEPFIPPADPVPEPSSSPSPDHSGVKPNNDSSPGITPSSAWSSPWSSPRPEAHVERGSRELLSLSSRGSYSVEGSWSGDGMESPSEKGLSRSNSFEGFLCPPLPGQVPVEPTETSTGRTARRAVEASPVNESSTESFESLYNVEKLIGSGVFGRVFLGTRKFDGKKVAIKRIRKIDNDRYLYIPGNREPLVTEVALLMMMRREPISPFVIQLYEWFEHPKEFSLVMEYPEAYENLYDIITRQPWSEWFSRVVMRQAVRAVLHCIHHGVFHNDIHAENFLFEKDTLDLKLIDFGCGQLFSSEGYESNRYRGFREYCPPEVITEPRFHAVPANVWSLGVLLYELSNFCLPFRNRTEITQAEVTFQNPNLSKQYLDDLQDLIFEHVFVDPAPYMDEVLKIPILSDLCAEYERPDKEEVISIMVSRFNHQLVGNQHICPDHLETHGEPSSPHRLESRHLPDGQGNPSTSSQRSDMPETCND
ncbi:unnamed protein product [Leuciscus chuanchicus]